MARIRSKRRQLPALIEMFREKEALSSEEINSVFGYYQAADALVRLRQMGLDIRAVGFVAELTQIRRVPQKHKRLFKWVDIDDWEGLVTPGE